MFTTNGCMHNPVFALFVSQYNPYFTHFYSVKIDPTNKSAAAYFMAWRLNCPNNAPHTPNSATQLVLFGRWITLTPPPKLCKKITEAHYIDMAEPCSEHLEVLNAAEEDHSKSSRSKPKDISSNLDWVQAFMWLYCQKISPIV